jgi:hypothetical protein
MTKLSKFGRTGDVLCKTPTVYSKVRWKSRLLEKWSCLGFENPGHGEVACNVLTSSTSLVSWSQVYNHSSFAEAEAWEHSAQNSLIIIWPNNDSFSFSLLPIARLRVRQNDVAQLHPQKPIWLDASCKNFSPHSGRVKVVFFFMFYFLFFFGTLGEAKGNVRLLIILKRQTILRSPERRDYSTVADCPERCLG